FQTQLSKIHLSVKNTEVRPMHVKMETTDGMGARERERETEIQRDRERAREHKSVSRSFVRAQKQPEGKMDSNGSIRDMCANNRMSECRATVLSRSRAN